jgi:hypothetical protein
MKDEFDITEEVIALREKFRNQTGIDWNNNLEFLKYLPQYCDWLEEEIITINKQNEPRCSNIKCEKFSSCKCNNIYYLCPIK